MPSTIALTVTRYRPEQESEPTFHTYEVPFLKDLVVLDALNHVKDTLDGSLSFRWSCRMGVCGSCGMKVNGTPKLTCATFLSDYLPGPLHRLGEFRLRLGGGAAHGPRGFIRRAGESRAAAPELP